MLARLLFLLMVAGGIYYYQNVMRPDAGMTVKALLDKAATTPVSSDEARVAFRNAAIDLCVVNGSDTANGLGTTEQCLARLNSRSDALCASRAIGDSPRNYRTPAELKPAFSDYLHCVVEDLTP